MRGTEGTDPVALLRRAVAADDRPRISALVSTYPLELWFGILPADLQVIVDTADDGSARATDLGGYILRAFLAGPARADLPDGTDAGAAPGIRRARTFIRALHLRMSGDPVQAYALMSEDPLVRAPVAPLLDPTRGTGASIVLQAGITAMLAGRLHDALMLLEKSLLFPIPPALAFFHRDAHLRIAMIHALYGDGALAWMHLDLSRQVPRTASWAEPGLDTDESLVEALSTAETDPDAAFTALLRIPIPRMQELWPYHVVATQHIGMITGRLREMHDRASQFRALNPAGVGGTGLGGSVVAHTLGLHALLAGASSESERLLATADPRLWETATLAAGQALVRGSAPPAIRLLHGVADQTAGLPRADNFRRMVLAVAHDVSGAHDDADAILSDILPRPDVLTHAMLTRFAPSFAARAANDIPGWPAPRTAPETVDTLRRRALTTRELDVLAELARGRSRTEIAQQLFITVNTVKTHQRSLYRKLGATTRTEAVNEGRRRALL